MKLLTVLTATLLFILIIKHNPVSGKGLKERFSWTRIDYVWSNKRNIRQVHQKNKYSNNLSKIKPMDGILFPGNTNVNEKPQQESSRPPPEEISYIYENNIPMGANVWKNKLFITVPRRRLGVPSTLNYIDLNNAPSTNPPLIPYPNWETNIFEPNTQSRNIDRFVSVYRVAVDSCDRLWFVDTGIIELPGNITQIQPTTLIIMDLKTDRIIRKYVFKNADLRDNTNLASVTIDESQSCNDDNVYAYMPDLAGYGLIVYSLKENQSWRITHNYFYLEPTSGEFQVAGHNFQWTDGIFSVALTDVKPNGFRDAYFHSMAGLNLYKVSTRILRNESLATRSYHGDDFKLVGNRGDLSQTSASALHDKTGVLFMGYVNQNALTCWNTRHSLRDISTIQKNNEKMIYPCDVKISGDNIILLTNTMPEFLYGQLNYDQINFRVWMENVNQAIKHTKCI